MSFRDPYRRRRSSAPRWILMAILLTGAAVLGAVGHRAWQRSVEAARDEALESEIAALRSELQTTNATLAALESRLVSVEARDPSGPLAALQATVDSLRDEMAGLSRRVETLQPGSGGGEGIGSPAPSEIHLSVARQSQSHSLSCESSAASMAAQYHGVPLAESDVLNALPRNDNPHLGFRGNVDGPPGGIEDYGVYALPILAVLNSTGLRATMVEGGIEGIKAALARGNPVVAWITYNCMVSTPVTVAVDGQEVSLVPYQHAVVVTGYNEAGVWANDPYDGLEDFYATADFARALQYFGNMAIEVALP